jgi:hypothetical protein
MSNSFGDTDSSNIDEANTLPRISEDSLLEKASEHGLENDAVAKRPSVSGVLKLRNTKGIILSFKPELIVLRNDLKSYHIC